jgi:ATP-binding cassette, subfamily B, bacterial PglK
MNKIRFVKKILTILGIRKKKIPWLILLFIAISVIDLIGISIIGPYISLILDSSSFTQSDLYIFSTSIGMPSDYDQLVVISGLVLIVVFAFKSLAGIMMNWIILRFCFEQGAILRSLLMKKYLNLPYQVYLNRNSSSYIYNIKDLTRLFSESFLLAFMRLISEGIVATVIVLFLAWYRWQELMILVALLAMTVFFYDYIFNKKIKKYGTLSNKYSTLLVQAIHEGIDGLKELRILGKQGYFQKAVEQQAKGYSDVGIKSHIISTMPRYLLELILIIFVVLLILLSPSDRDGADFISTLAVFGVASMRLAPSVSQILHAITQIKYGQHTVDLLYSDLCKLSEISPGRKDEKLNDSNIFKYIEFKNVSFLYPNTKTTVISNASIRINSGDSIGFVGGSGSGKTSVIDLILGLLEPQDGLILYNGDPMQNHIREWRSKVAYLPQEVFLTDDSLRSNIAMGEYPEDINDDLIYQALLQADLSGFVRQLPEGIDTILGERGSRISGGQRQRIALARAFYNRRDVLIMDESTSALDDDTENEILNEIKRLKGRKTIIIIAHRLSTLKHCDRIFHLKNGILLEE